MKPFTKNEIKGVLMILIVVFSVTAYNMSISLRRARDAQRKGDLGLVSDALIKFYGEYGYFPLSDNGKIKMCKAENFDEMFNQAVRSNPFDRQKFFEGLRGCEWGKDGLFDLLDPKSEPYLKTLPSDPRTSDGSVYLYLANINRFQLYSFLEGSSEESGFDNGIVKRNLMCGNKVCSFGKSYAIPVDREINEYELELMQKASGKGK